MIVMILSHWRRYSAMCTLILLTRQRAANDYSPATVSTTSSYGSGAPGASTVGEGMPSVWAACWCLRKAPCR